jgi:hypothetical protein
VIGAPITAESRGLPFMRAYFELQHLASCPTHLRIRAVIADDATGDCYSTFCMKYQVIWRASLAAIDDPAPPHRDFCFALLDPSHIPRTFERLT